MLKLSEEQLLTMQNVIKSAEFEKKQLRTQNYGIRTIYHDVKRKNREYETVFSGYECEQEFLLKFPMDIQRLNSVLKSIDICEVKPVFNIKFTLSNARAAHDEALCDAAINAHHEAELITEASGVQLGELLKIDMTSNSYSRLTMSEFSSTSSLSIGETGIMQPDNITVEASAEFIWEIKS